jgi:retron-type reverse transcriptase
MIEEILDPENLARAWQRVKGNNHDRLMNALREKVRCRRTLGLIRRYLMAGVELPDGTREATPQGVPQGGPLSPLLANIAPTRSTRSWRHADTGSRVAPTTSS